MAAHARLGIRNRNRLSGRRVARGRPEERRARVSVGRHQLLQWRQVRHLALDRLRQNLHHHRHQQPVQNAWQRHGPPEWRKAGRRSGLKQRAVRGHALERLVQKHRLRRQLGPHDGAQCHHHAQRGRHQLCIARSNQRQRRRGAAPAGGRVAVRFGWPEPVSQQRCWRQFQRGQWRADGVHASARGT